MFRAPGCPALEDLGKNRADLESDLAKIRGPLQSIATSNKPIDLAQIKPRAASCVRRVDLCLSAIADVENKVGNPCRLEEVADKWQTQVHKPVADLASSYDGDLRATKSWGGPAGDAYLETVAKQKFQLNQISDRLDLTVKDLRTLAHYVREYCESINNHLVAFTGAATKLMELAAQVARIIEKVANPSIPLPPVPPLPNEIPLPPSPGVDVLTVLPLLDQIEKSLDKFLNGFHNQTKTWLDGGHLEKARKSFDVTQPQGTSNPEAKTPNKGDLWWFPAIYYFNKVPQPPKDAPQTPTTPPAPTPQRSGSATNGAGADSTTSAQGNPDAAAWAKAKVGAGGWNNKCELFAEQAFGTRGKFPTATAHYEWQKSAGRIRTDSPPPAGAVVFFKSTTPAGHVMVATGEGHSAISTGDTVYKENDVRSRDDYLGWAPAPAEW